MKLRTAVVALASALLHLCTLPALAEQGYTQASEDGSAFNARLPNAHRDWDNIAKFEINPALRTLFSNSYGSSCSAIANPYPYQWCVDGTQRTISVYTQPQAGGAFSWRTAFTINADGTLNQATIANGTVVGAMLAPGAAVQNIGFNPVQSVAGRAGNVVLTASDITNGTTAGRTLFTAASAAAQKSALAIAAGDVSGLAASATTDTTNASNISAGILPAARLPSVAGTYPTAASPLTFGSGEQFLLSFRNSNFTGNSVYQQIYPGATNYDSLQGVLDVPPGSTAIGANAIAGYFRGRATNGTKPVALFGSGTVEAPGVGWGVNTLLQDSATRTAGTATGRALIGYESDLNVMNPGTTAIGFSTGGNSLAQPTSGAGYNLAQLGTGYYWPTGFGTQNGAAQNGVALGTYAGSSGANSPSQKFQFGWTDASNASQATTMQMTGGYLSLQSTGAWNGLAVQGAGISAPSLNLSGSAAYGSPLLRTITTEAQTAGTDFVFANLMQATRSPGGSGHREALSVIQNSSDAAATEFVVGGQATGHATAGSGLVFGWNPYCLIDSGVDTTAQCTGEESNTDIRNTSVVNKTGIQIVDVKTSTGYGTTIDAGLAIFNQTGGRGYGNAIQIGTGIGNPGVANGGSILVAAGGNVTNGIDLSRLGGLNGIITGNAWLSPGALIGGVGDATFRTVKGGIFTVAALPACNSGAEGTRAGVTDATSPTFLGTLTGGGAVHTPVYCNGTAWVPG